MRAKDLLLPAFLGGMIFMGSPAFAMEWTDLQTRIQTSAGRAAISATQSNWLQTLGESINQRKAQMMVKGSLSAAERASIDLDLTKLTQLFDDEVRKGNSNSWDPSGSTYVNRPSPFTLASVVAIPPAQAATPVNVVPNSINNSWTALQSRIQQAANTGTISSYQLWWLQSQGADVLVRMQELMTRNNGILKAAHERQLLKDITRIDDRFAKEVKKGNSISWDPQGSRYLRTTGYGSGLGTKIGNALGSYNDRVWLADRIESSRFLSASTRQAVRDLLLSSNDSRLFW